MERVDPKLLLTFDRPVGRRWSRPVIGVNKTSITATSGFGLGQICVINELLVPSTPGNNGVNLTSLANSMYIAAREHNMSLSAYGHLDPVKFVFAATMLALYVSEIKRDLSTINQFTFGNETKGNLLVYAATGMSYAAITPKIPAIILRLNMIINRVNQLYIPAMTALADWLPHRARFYKDDEGERYQLYFYRMANMYELDVDPESDTVGQLIFKPTTHDDSLEDRLTYVENLLAKYEGDDDFVNFAVEAIKAGLGRIEIQPISSDGTTKINLPEYQEVFDIDDVCSLDNSYTVAPVFVGLVDGEETYLKLHWNIIENIQTGKFEVGRFGRNVNALPIVHPVALLAGSEVTYLPDPVSNRPIFTHARISSDEGMRALTRYIAGVDQECVSVQDIQVLDDVHFLENGVEDSIQGWGMSTSDKNIVLLKCHSSTMINGFTMYEAIESGDGVQEFTPQIFGCYVPTDPKQYLRAFKGFKIRPYVYGISLVDEQTVGNFHPFFHDFDYITSVSEENLNQYNSMHLWNGFILLSGTVGDRPQRNNKHKKMNKKGGKSPDKVNRSSDDKADGSDKR